MAKPGDVAQKFREAVGTVELIVKTGDARLFTEYDAAKLEQCAIAIRTLLRLPAPKVHDLRGPGGARRGDSSGASPIDRQEGRSGLAYVFARWLARRRPDRSRPRR